MLCCKEAARLLSESLDRRLTFRQAASLRFHLLLCRFCRHFSRDLNRFAAVLRIYARKIDADSTLAEITLRPEARQRIAQAMEKESL